MEKIISFINKKVSKNNLSLIIYLIYSLIYFVLICSLSDTPLPIDRQVFGDVGNLFTSRLLSFLIHFANILLLEKVLSLALNLKNSFIRILLFHPIYIFTIINISMTSIIFASFLLLFSIFFYLKQVGYTKFFNLYYALSFLLYYFAIQESSLIVFLPIALLLVNMDFRFESFKRKMLKTLPFVMIMVIKSFEYLKTLNIVGSGLDSKELFGIRVFELVNTSLFPWNSYPIYSILGVNEYYFYAALLILVFILINFFFGKTQLKFYSLVLILLMIPLSGMFLFSFDSLTPVSLNLFYIIYPIFVLFVLKILAEVSEFVRSRQQAVIIVISLLNLSSAIYHVKKFYISDDAFFIQAKLNAPENKFVFNYYLTKALAKEDFQEASNYLFELKPYLHLYNKDFLDFLAKVEQVIYSKLANEDKANSEDKKQEQQ